MNEENKVVTTCHNCESDIHENDYIDEDIFECPCCFTQILVEGYEDKEWSDFVPGS